MASASTFNNLEDALNAAMASDCYLVAIWRIENGIVHLYRETESFPHEDFENAQELLRRDLAAAVTNANV